MDPLLQLWHLPWEVATLNEFFIIYYSLGLLDIGSERDNKYRIVQGAPFLITVGS